MGEYLDMVRRQREQSSDIRREDTDANAGDTKNEFNELTNRVASRSLQADMLERVAGLRSAWKWVCCELAEALNWPRVGLAPSRAGHVGSGEGMWRIYLGRASVVELEMQVAPELRRMLSDVGMPEGEERP